MRLRRFRGVPTSASGFADPGRCVRGLRVGKPAALQQIQSIFADALIYVTTELLPKDTEKVQVAGVVLDAFQSLWEHRESIQNPVDTRNFLNTYVLDACRRLYPGLDEQKAQLIVAFSEIARMMLQTERALPKKYQRFYKMKFVLRAPDAAILEELGLSPEEFAQYTQEVKAYMSTMPKWG